MQRAQDTSNSARHARLFELIRQQNLAAAHDPHKAAESAELNDAQSFIAAAQYSLKMAG